MYFEILVCYDIGDNKRRRKLVNELKDIGLIGIQESVFWGRVLNAELQTIKRILETLLKKQEDKAFILRVDLSKQIQNNNFGYTDLSIFEERDYDIL